MRKVESIWWSRDKRGNPKLPETSTSSLDLSRIKSYSVLIISIRLFITRETINRKKALLTCAILLWGLIWALVVKVKPARLYLNSLGKRKHKPFELSLASESKPD